MIISGFSQDAIAQFKELVHISLFYHDNQSLAKAYHIMSDVYADLGELEDALKYAEKYNSTAQELGTAKELQGASATIGRIYYLLGMDSTGDLREEYLKKSLGHYTASQSHIEKLTSVLSKNELLEMRACLYLNIALLYEEWGDLENAENKFRLCATISQICSSKDTELKALISLSSLKLFQAEYEDALNFADEADRVAVKLKNKSSSAEIQFIKAKIKLSQGEFEVASKLLKNCYQNLNLIPDTTTEDFTYIASLAIRGLQSLKLLPSTKTLKSRATLFHKIGSILFKLKSYKIALKYFKDELNILENSGSDDLDVFSPLRYSSECFLHINNYNEALIGFNRCISMLDDSNPLKANILYKIAICKDKLHLSFSLANKTFTEAFELAKQNNDMNLKWKIADRMNQLYQKHNKTLNSHEILDTLAAEIETDDSGSELSISDIDMELEFEKLSETASSQKQTQQKPKGKQIVQFNPNKRNEVGETLLHVACIRGNIERVVELIHKGADVNLRDNCGWTPLHEACNHGYCEIVEILLDSGAFVNDRGGVKCDGITPLIDAAENLHLNVIELLLSRGADPTITTVDGSNVLEILRKHMDDQDCQIQSDIQRIICLIKQKYQNPNFCPVLKPKEENISNTRLEALANDRVPLIIAANTSNDSLKRKRKTTIPALLPAKEVKAVVLNENHERVRCKRKRSQTVLSQECVVNKFEPQNFTTTQPGVSPIKLIQVNFSHIIDSTQSLTPDKSDTLQMDIVPLASQNIVFNVNLINSKNSAKIDIDEHSTAEVLIQRINNIYSHDISSIVLVQGNDIIFPFEIVGKIYKKSSKVDCHLVETTSLVNVYANLCRITNTTPSKLHSSLLTKKCHCLYRYNIKSLSSLTKLLFYTFIKCKIDVLDFSYIHTTSEDYVNYVSQLLSLFKSPRVLNLSNCSFSWTVLQKVEKLADSSLSLRNLEILDLSHNSFDVESSVLCDCLSKIISNSPSLHTLNISYCNIPNIFDPESSLASIVQDHSQLKSLIFSGIQFTESMTTHLFSSFIPWNHLELLDLSEINYSFDFLYHLSNYLMLSKKHINRLNISNNPISNQICLFLNIPSLYHLVELDLSNTLLESDSILSLRYELMKFEKLKILKLYNNILSFSNLQELSDFIHSCSNMKSLQYLDLSKTLSICEASDISPPIFHSQINSNTSLKTIILDQNNFSDNTVNSFITNFNLSNYRPTINGISFRLDILYNL